MEFSDASLPQVRGTFLSDSYEGSSGHPLFMSYLRGEKGDCVGVQTGEIMQSWVSKPIVSEGYSVCYPVIAIDSDQQAQMIHMSRDPWRQTNTDEYWRRLREWKEMGCDVTAMKAARSSLVTTEDVEIKKLMGNRFLFIDLKVDSRFGLVVDPRSRLLLVQLTDAKELREYKI